MSNLEQQSSISEPDSKKQLVISYLILRRAVGLLGVMLPISMVLSTWLTDIEIQETISHFYYTPMRDVFVGTLCTIGLFLFSYNGYTKIEKYAGTVACICAVGVALIPTAPSCSVIVSGFNNNHQIAAASCMHCLDGNLLDCLHKFFAISLFLILAWFSLISFPKSAPGTQPCSHKLKCNRAYRISGWVILSAIALIFVTAWLNRNNDGPPPFNLVFWLESVAIMAFGFAWLVKGQALMKNPPSKST